MDRGTLSQPQNCSTWTFLHSTFNWESCGNSFPVLGWKPMYANTLTWTTSGKKRQTRKQENFIDGGYPYLSQPQNCSKWTFLHNTFNWESCGNSFPVLGWKPMYSNTLTWTTSEKKANQESRKLYGSGVPFPSPKTVQNEHFYIILLTEKVAVTFFSVLGWRPMYANTLTWTTSWKEKPNQESIKLYGWGGTLSQPQNCSKWTFLHNTFNWESCGNFFPVLGWKPMYANTLTWTTSGKKKANQESRKLYCGWGGTLSQPQNCSKRTFVQNTFNWESCGNFFHFWDEGPCTQTP